MERGALKLSIQKESARETGEFFLKEAQYYLRCNDLENAFAFVNEGMIRTCGPFMLGVRDRLHDLRVEIETRRTPCVLNR